VEALWKVGEETGRIEVEAGWCGVFASCLPSLLHLCVFFATFAFLLSLALPSSPVLYGTNLRLQFFSFRSDLHSWWPFWRVSARVREEVKES